MTLCCIVVCFCVVIAALLRGLKSICWKTFAVCNALYHWIHSASITFIFFGFITSVLWSNVFNGWASRKPKEIEWVWVTFVD